MSDSMLLLDIGASAGELPNITPAPTVYGCWFPVPHQATPVPTVSGLTATSVADGILLEWDAIDLPGVVYVIERASEDTGPWIELARTTNTHYLVSDPSGDTWLFRVIALVRGRAGGETWVEGSSKVIADDEDIAELIEKQKEIDEARVLEKVELIDLNAETLIEETLRSHELNDLRRKHENTLDRAVETITLLIEDGQVTAQQVVDLFAQLDDETSTRQAQYQQLNEAIVDETSARVSADTSLHAQVTTEIGNASAALNEHIDTVEANANSALASAKTTLGAQIIAGDNAVSNALQQEINTVEANANSALASAKTTLGAQITAGDAAVSTALHTRADQVEATAASARTTMQNTWAAQLNNTQALLQSNINTKVTANQAEAIAQTKVQAFQNGTYAALEQSFNVVASEHNNMHGKWSASWGVKLTGGTFNGQPIVAGISMSANPNTGSDFIIQSNNFYIISPSASDGLELRNGYLRVFRGNAQRIIGNGFGQGSQLVDYFGPNVGTGNASKTNAVMWMDSSGNAGFNGTVSAANIVGQVQNAVTVYWEGNIDLIANKSNSNRWITKGYFEPLTTFTLPAPTQVGTSHRPMFFLTVNLNNVGYGIQLRLERLVNGTWQPYHNRGNAIGIALMDIEKRVHTYVGESQAQLVHLGAATGQAEQFRISVKCSEAALNSNGKSASDTRVVSVYGFVVGIR